MAGLEQRTETVERGPESFHNEMRGLISVVHSEVRRLDTVSDMRERLILIETSWRN
ncbi:MAG: hypothetical protein ACREQ4_00080 [Candidatus Binataceae bacterium]